MRKSRESLRYVLLYSYNTTRPVTRRLPRRSCVLDGFYVSRVANISTPSTPANDSALTQTRGRLQTSHKEGTPAKRPCKTTQQTASSVLGNRPDESTYAPLGTVVFALNQPNFDAIADRWIYSFFFCVNAGLGVGNVPLKPTKWYTKLIASAFCFCGHTMVIGGAAVYFAVQSDTVMKKVALGPVREEQVRRQRLLYHGAIFLAFVMLGVLIAFTTAQLSGWMMAFEFSVTMLTSAGLVEGHLA